uniref:Uncharacterized protein n=1 Tax=Amphora coffeiformis TaxID=265554 RepID=A0A7S3LI07_9STRA|mmetsp:Transcript_15936/g.32210  ORF Transcript_15936/g.32210 Transcript_15936/m.32210 type:complete len:130 (+) Transcript_15936:60-449(+)|eukprot:scaffold1753_cov153-Amphora_coffeaeformis.AAC.1
MEDHHSLASDMTSSGFTNCTQQQLQHNNETVLCSAGIVKHDRSSANFYFMLAFLLLLTVVPAIFSVIYTFAAKKDTQDMPSSASDGDTVVLEKEYEEDDLDGDDGDEEAPTCSTHNSETGSDTETVGGY